MELYRTLDTKSAVKREYKDLAGSRSYLLLGYD